MPNNAEIIAALVLPTAGLTTFETLVCSSGYYVTGTGFAHVYREKQNTQGPDKLDTTILIFERLLDDNFIKIVLIKN